MAKSKKVNEFTVVGFRCYQTVSRGTTLTLSIQEDGWLVQGVNVCSKAYNSLGSYRHFDTLQDVEAAYKGLVGVMQFDVEKQAEELMARLTLKEKA